MSEVDFTIHNVTSTDRSRLASLIHFGAYVHQHLDWKSPLDWIGRHPYLSINEKGDVFAALACPPDLPEIAWIRLFAVNSNINIDYAWKHLWEAALNDFPKFGITQAAALSMQSWFTELLLGSKFELTDNVIILTHDDRAGKKIPSTDFVNIRPMDHEDLRTIAEIDNSAFSSEWRNSVEALELAFQQSSYTTVAEIGDEIVGYQYSTSSGFGGHLARLAIKEERQRNGIGFSLVHDMLNHFQKFGITHITVNTQQSNIASLALYAKAGFTITGEKYQVYKYHT